MNKSKKKLLSEERLHTENLRWDNWVNVDGYMVQLNESHMSTQEKITPVRMSEEMLPLMGFHPSTEGGPHRVLTGWVLRVEQGQWWLFFEERPVPKPMYFAHQVQNTVYVLAGEDI